MDFETLANEYCDLNVFNADTRTTITWAAVLFDRRAACSVKNLSPAAIARFKIATLQTAKSVTYNGYLRYLRLLGDYAVSQEYLGKNWFRLAKAAPSEIPLPKTMSDNTLWQLVCHVTENTESCRPSWFWIAVIKTFYFTGIRRRQLVGLRVGDVDFEGNILSLRAATSKTRREWKIPLHPIVAECMLEVIARSEDVLGRSLTGADPVFNICRFVKSYHPDPEFPDMMRRRSITDFFKRIKKQTGLEVGSHRFRHTLATKLCNPSSHEPDVFGVQSILGHTSVQTTRGYVQTNASRLERLIETLELPALANRTLSSQ